eukprot:TRINITY_DN40094_c0_g1_i1.p1 TRINITY_DN40094_c0_g1~~TRINITY_DN40094_c0_g1_i1.p1  ORF type:complete len:445 (+),score=90.89 TRINITY_DN40094_c0_g1_i1:568-1902(+)
MGATECKPAVACQPQRNCCVNDTATVAGDELVVGASHAFLDAESVIRSLPKELSPHAVLTVRQTALALAPRAEEIAKTFYKRITDVDMHVFFNATNQRTGKQPSALAATIVAFASNLERPGKLRPVLDLVAAKHCAMNVKPHHYLTVHAVLMASFAEVLGGDLSSETAGAWSEAILFLSRMLIDREKAMYDEAKNRNGGWRGFLKFVVTRRQQETEDVVVFTMKPMDATGVYFDFHPGQFVSVKVDPDGEAIAPRHYTVISPLGMPYLQIAVKKLPGGKVSTYMHERVAVGQCIHLSPPFGVFTPVPAALGEKSTAVLLSAGIGITPMLAFMQALGAKVMLAAHVDRCEDAHPFRERFANASSFAVHYTRDAEAKGRPSKDYAAELARKVGFDHDWYICGPVAFMCDAMQSLSMVGVDTARIHFEAFSPQLCPMRDQALAELNK